MAHESAVAHMNDFCEESTSLASALIDHDDDFYAVVDAGNNDTEEESRPTKNRRYTYFTRNKTQRFQCEYCLKIIAYKSKFLEHMRVHTGERPFKCSVCSASFTQRGALKSHERTHDRPTYRMCSECGRSGFMTATQLGQHMRMHTRETHLAIENGEIYLQEEYGEAEAPQQDNVQYETIEEYYIGPPDKLPEMTNPDPKPQNANEDVDFEDEGNEDSEPPVLQIAHPALRWHVSHVSGSNKSDQNAETELRVNRLMDGRLEVNGVAVEGDYYEGDDVTVYYFTLSSGEILTFVFDHNSNVLEIIESSEVPPMLSDAVDETVESADVEGNQYHEQDFEELYEVVNSEHQEEPHTSELADYRDVDVDHHDSPEIHTTVVVKAEPIEKEILVESRQSAVEPRTNSVIELHPVHDGDDGNVSSQERIFRRSRERNRKSRNLEWIINAIAEGKPLEDATPHNRKKPVLKTCEFCGLQLKYPSKIAAHMRTHTGEKPYVCQICGRGFAINTTLKMHVRRHLKQRLFTCTHPHCGRSFVNGALLNHHYQSRHVPRRKFACLRGCGSSFYSNREREIHESTCVLVLEQINEEQTLHIENPDTMHPLMAVQVEVGTENDERTFVDAATYVEENAEHYEVDMDVEEGAGIYEEYVDPTTGAVEKWYFVPEQNDWMNETDFHEHHDLQLIEHPHTENELLIENGNENFIMHHEEAESLVAANLQ